MHPNTEIMEKIGIIGCGNLGLSLVKGFRKQYPNAVIYGTRRNPELLQAFADEQTIFTADNARVLRECNTIILALKPYTILDFLSQHASEFDAKRHTVISVATGKTLHELAAALGNESYSLYRAMPNTAADVQESMTALSSLNDPLNKKAAVEELFQCDRTNRLDRRTIDGIGHHPWSVWYCLRSAFYPRDDSRWN